jgi:hypothetical protein
VRGRPPTQEFALNRSLVLCIFQPERSSIPAPVQTHPKEVTFSKGMNLRINPSTQRAVDCRGALQHPCSGVRTSSTSLQASSYHTSRRALHRHLKAVVVPDPLTIPNDSTRHGPAEQSPVSPKQAALAAPHHTNRVVRTCIVAAGAPVHCPRAPVAIGCVGATTMRGRQMCSGLIRWHLHYT